MASARCEADPDSCFPVGCVSDRLGSVVSQPGDDELPCADPEAYGVVDWESLDEAALRCELGFEVGPYDGICVNSTPDEWRYLVSCSPFIGPA
jgi:hypothetical protein